MRREWGARWARVDGIVRGATVEDEDDSGVGSGRGEDAQAREPYIIGPSLLLCAAMLSSFGFRASRVCVLCGRVEGDECNAYA